MNQTWDDYWKNFDQLCSMLTMNNKTKIETELQKAKRYVNGLTDGWYDFLNAFTAIIDNNKKDLSTEEHQLAEFLLSSLKKSLNKV